ncbi:kynureninase [Nakamurella endophytica]|uniref:Kynureninase n=1 Tax=Nakamurella endophytica TaxID=1748367 RepID=A0A917SP69_9ACTN|nr:kynureninase [Nakamurella endophytica]GGL89475.1 kynureninase [Nakamurella endophytica]
MSDVNGFRDVLDRSAALARDRADPLRDRVDLFLPTGPDVVAYLDGNSLGRPAAAVADAWAGLARDWAGRLIRGWDEGWMELPGTVGDELAASVLGAAPGQTVVADSTTVNLYKCLRAALNLRPGRRRVVVDRDNFPTNRYVAQSLARDLGLELVWLAADPDGGVRPEDVAGVLDDDTAVVTLSHVAYRSGFLADMEAITDLAHRAGALVLWDLCHSAGVLPVELDRCEVDFAAGCTYKFLGAGPGAPAFLYVHRRHHDRLDQPIWGWLGGADPFQMGPDHRPAPGIRSMLSGTPPIAGLLAVREGVRVVADAGVPAIRAKSVALGEWTVALADAWLAPLGVEVASPRDPARRGGHVSLRHPDARRLCAELAAAGVLPDFRTPDVVRVGLAPLTTSFTAVWDALAVLRDLLSGARPRAAADPTAADEAPPMAPNG